MLVVGLTGGMGQGKSTVGRMLRELGGVGPECDLESFYVLADLLNQWLQHWPPLKLGPGEDVAGLANRLITSLLPVLESFLGEAVDGSALKIVPDASNDDHQKFLDYLTRRLAAPSQSEQFPMPINNQTKKFHRELLQWLGGNCIQQGWYVWNRVNARKIEQLRLAGQNLVTVGGLRSGPDAEMVQHAGGVVVRVVRPEIDTVIDTTEQFYYQLRPDAEIINSGTIEQLEAAVKQLYADLVSGKINP